MSVSGSAGENANENGYLQSRQHSVTTGAFYANYEITRGFHKVELAH